jgi:hypothetical protein
MYLLQERSSQSTKDTMNGHYIFSFLPYSQNQSDSSSPIFDSIPECNRAKNSIWVVLQWPSTPKVESVGNLSGWDETGQDFSPEYEHLLQVQHLQPENDTMIILWTEANTLSKVL